MILQEKWYREAMLGEKLYSILAEVKRAQDPDLHLAEQAIRIWERAGRLPEVLQTLSQELPLSYLLLSDIHSQEVEYLEYLWDALRAAPPSGSAKWAESLSEEDRRDLLPSMDFLLTAYFFANEGDQNHDLRRYALEPGSFFDTHLGLQQKDLWSFKELLDKWGFEKREQQAHPREYFLQVLEDTPYPGSIFPRVDYELRSFLIHVPGPYQYVPEEQGLQIVDAWRSL